MRAENKVTKYEVKKSIMEINKNETRNVTKGFVCNNADNATTIKMCNTLTEAKEEFKKSNETHIVEYSSYYLITEYYIEEVEYIAIEEDDAIDYDLSESIGVHDISDMIFEVYDKATSKTVAKCDTFEEAESALYDCEDGFISFS